MKYLRIIPAVFLIFCVGFTFFYSPKSKEEQINRPSHQGIISIWHIDTFEGGTGSRKSFLLNLALQFEKQNKNTLIMVSNYTIDGVKDAISKGKMPDMISYGNGVEISGLKELNIKSENVYGKVGDKTFAVPWCCGGYVLISKDKNLPQSKKLENLVVSQGEYTQPLLALNINGYLAGNIKVLSPQFAFAEFINGKSNYFVGTQRDVIRLSYKNFDYQVIPLEGYNDLYQYISITAQEDEKIKSAEKFIEFLLKDGTQKNLTKLNLFSDRVDVVYDNENLNKIQKSNFNKGISVFTKVEILKEMQELSLKAVKGDESAYTKIKNIIF